MKRQLYLLVFAAGMMAFTFQSCSEKDPTTTPTYYTFKSDMRSLWSDHVVWTRIVILAIIDNEPGLNDAVTRLLQNQVDIGNAVKPYYGDANGNALKDLLYIHINTAADLVTAAANNNTSDYNTAVTAWYNNADDIAETLNSLNPDNWKLDDMKMMMKEHLDNTAAEVTARLSNDYAGDVAAFDVVYDQAMHMADMLSEGIAKQYPDKF